MENKVLILHGRDGIENPDNHQLWLAREIRRAGVEVRFPVLTGMYSKSLIVSKGEILQELTNFCPDVVACHSLAVLAMLHVLFSDSSIRINKILLVAPARFSPPKSVFPSFYPVPNVDLTKIARDVWLVMAKNDPYRTEDEGKAIEKELGVRTTWLESGQHLSGEEGFGPWPEALEFCLG